MASRRPVRRRTNYRPARRRSSRRGSDGGGWVVLVIVVGVVGLIVQTIARHLIAAAVVLVLLAGAIAAGIVVYRKRRQARFEIHATHAYTLAEYQRMDAKQFEISLAQLCRRDGCTNVQVVGGAGDRGADVICTTPDGRRLVIQAKRFAVTNKVKDEVVQVVNGTYRDAHRGDLAAIVTTSSFTKPALQYARQLGIRPYDGTKLAAWASRTGPAPWQ